MFRQALRLLHTVRHLRPVQITTRLRRQVVRGRPDLRPAPPQRGLGRKWTHRGARPAIMTGPRRFRLLNVEREVEVGVWRGSGWPRLWVYNLHYFDDMLAAGADDRREWHAALIDEWVDANPPASGIGWDPYPLSRRVPNWIAWSLAGNKLSDRALDSLAVQLRWLTQHLEYRLLANHLLANAKALVFGGAYFDGAEADAWLAEGLAILDEQLPEQVLSDGGHIERSPMYHSVITEDLLDLVRLAELSGDQIPPLADKLPEWRLTAARMLNWLAAMSHPDGQIALFNDAAFDVALPPAALVADAASLNVDVPAPPVDGITHLQTSGYLRMQQDDAVLICDAAPLGPDYQPGHGHADALTFEMSLGGARLIVDTGTSRYENGAQRLAERGTAAHNTVEVDGADSSEIWDSFRVARRVHPTVHWAKDRGADGLDVEAAYKGCSKPGGHQRRWQLLDSVLTITDTVHGRHFRHAVARFHLHPDVVLVTGSGAAHRAGDISADQLAELVPSEVRLRVADRDVVFTSCDTIDTFTEFDYHPRFGAAERSVCIECELQGRGATFYFDWNANGRR